MKMPGTNILRIFGICLTGKHHANVIMLKFKGFFFSVLLDFSLLNLEFRLTFFLYQFIIYMYVTMWESPDVKFSFLRIVFIHASGSVRINY